MLTQEDIKFALLPILPKDGWSELYRILSGQFYKELYDYYNKLNIKPLPYDYEGLCYDINDYCLGQININETDLADYSHGLMLCDDVVHLIYDVLPFDLLQASSLVHIRKNFKVHGLLTIPRFRMCIDGDSKKRFIDKFIKAVDDYTLNTASDEISGFKLISDILPEEAFMLNKILSVDRMVRYLKEIIEQNVDYFLNNHKYLELAKFDIVACSDHNEEVVFQYGLIQKP